MPRRLAHLLGLAAVAIAGLAYLGGGNFGAPAQTSASSPQVEDSTMDQTRSPALEQSLAAFVAAGAEDILPVLTALTWTSRGTLGDAYDYLTGEYDVSASAVVASIRALSGRYSIPTPRQSEAVQAAPGGTIIPGSKFDFPACIRAEAREFRSKSTRRVSGHYSRAASASGAVPGSAHLRYQVNKCGNREYSLRTDATSTSYKPLSDGLAPEPPPRAKAGFAFGCCILEAKYAYGPVTAYQRRRDFLRATAKYANSLPRRLRGLGRPALIAYWTGINLDSTAQFGLYMGAIADPGIPYWKVVYICSQEKARDYFQDIISTAHVPRAIAVACVSDARRTTENWIV